MIAAAATLTVLLLLFAFCGTTVLVSIAAEHAVKAAARRWRGWRRPA